ncbi:flagellar hook assembly protein FlgD [Marinobacterium sedimentorum]|jgi:flagellar basal-body rod modification protein FlgD|uniref:flagellar hook assembly protein FlgD n=1 Tax=Marinobacterium sedimentorum TaxID=2927804 RepID=UPI0020C6599D|nr:flagellar hook capping FlgD N-terminal domain-containing protein [Marinobacterium sedimentorum]MCP8687559.1 flagellar biosynthesis protein FlgD [Marinobacterium sedimentorum]
MSTIDSNSNIFNQINQTNQSNSKATSADESDSEMFMKLMIAQLQNQDPTSPADTSDFMQQIASMSTVESIANLSTSVDLLGQSLMSSQAALQASSMVGQQAYVKTDLAVLPEGGKAEGLVSLDSSASNVWVSIYDRNGVLVDTQQMGAQSAGDHSFVWRGTENTPPGQYRVVAQAQVNGEVKTQDLYMGHRINSVTLGQNGIGMKVNTDVGSAGINDIKQLG